MNEYLFNGILNGFTGRPWSGLRNIGTSKDCKTTLDAQTPKGYDPKRYIVLIKDALRNAKNADQSKGWYPEPGNTKMHALIEALMKFVSVREFDAFVERVRGE